MFTRIEIVLKSIILFILSILFCYFLFYIPCINASLSSIYHYHFKFVTIVMIIYTTASTTTTTSTAPTTITITTITITILLCSNGYTHYYFINSQ